MQYRDELITVAGGEVGPLTRQFYQALTDIQYGRAADPFGWVMPVTELQLHLQTRVAGA